ncbi:MAG: efflux RND transporter periplasmic adaptor subunit [Gemmatimonadota bacterium]|jgi:multidrug efflux system membrane fusion protein
MKHTHAKRARATSLTALLIPLAVTACHGGVAQEPESVRREAQVVRTATVTEQTVSRPITATGTFGPKDEIALSFKIGGVVQSVHVDAGAPVRAGQVLASLFLPEIDAGLAKATSAAAKAERDLERARRLFADSVVTLSQLQDAETAFEVASADLQAAEFNRRYAVIVAPANGIILLRHAESGETVNPGTPIVTLGSRERGAVLRVGLADRDVVRLQAGDTALAHFDALPGRIFRGVVSEIGAAASPGTGTYAVEIRLSATVPLAAGMVGRVEIFPASGVSTAVVPVASLLEADGDEATVFVLTDDGAHVRRRTVEVAFLDADRVAVTEGLEGGVSVVTEGAAWLVDGDEVRVIR